MHQTSCVLNTSVGSESQEQHWSKANAVRHCCCRANTAVKWRSRCIHGRDDVTSWWFSSLWKSKLIAHPKYTITCVTLLCDLVRFTRGFLNSKSAGGKCAVFVLFCCDFFFFIIYTKGAFCSVE